ncbi:3-deoxy-D-manno-octulosonic acid transferase [Selenomonadales bacterium OttesenSCG-928-I06]|nr:3-deoxy-D-manno-octulosonic acid transferase [Selenomonadales bacterium OttesenSCG-928-I06]
MHFIYNILIIFIAILAMPMFISRAIKEEGFPERLKQSFGRLSPETLEKVANKDAIWLHAASVGEIVATSPIIKEIRKNLPDATIMISVVTANGYMMAKRIIPEVDGIIFFPLDLPFLSHSIVKKIRPKILLLVETELWPNFLKSARTLKIPVMMVNGRISERSFKGYTYMLGLVKSMVDTVVQFCMQSTIDAQHIIRLGADPRRVVVTGNTKFDQNYTRIDEQEKEELKHELAISSKSPIIVAGSTHRGEEGYIFNSFKEIKKVHKDAALIVAPREILRTNEVLDLAIKYGLPTTVKRTLIKESGFTNHDVIVLDTIGELGRFYGLGDVIYVGGSLVTQGGHNILEPAAHGKPILVGPHMFNFKDTYALFSERGACVTVYDNVSLTEEILDLLNNKEKRDLMSKESLDIIQENKGASQKTYVYLQELLARYEAKQPQN